MCADGLRLHFLRHVVEIGNAFVRSTVWKIVQNTLPIIENALRDWDTPKQKKIFFQAVFAFLKKPTINKTVVYARIRFPSIKVVVLMTLTLSDRKNSENYKN